MLLEINSFYIFIKEKVNHDRLIDRMAMLEQQLDFFRRRISDIASGDNSSIDSTEAATELTVRFQFIIYPIN